MLKVNKKFINPDITAKGEIRASVVPTQLDTLWINTGTLCNLECANCYIESSPKNDRLVYIKTSEVETLLAEIEDENLGTTEIGFTGGEPFMNKEMLPILKLCLESGYRVLVLTNAMKPMMKYKEQLLGLNAQYFDQLQIRVSLDHYTEKGHAQERGEKAWTPALEGIKWLSENNFNLSIAGRSIWGEVEDVVRRAYQKLFTDMGVSVRSSDPKNLVIFPEMDEDMDVPEITTSCWDILGKKPSDIMCANSRMVVKEKGKKELSVMACTLLPYDQRFNMGSTLKDSFKPVKLNHPHCAKFCVLGGGSCS